MNLILYLIITAVIWNGGAARGFMSKTVVAAISVLILWPPVHLRCVVILVLVPVVHLGLKWHYWAVGVIVHLWILVTIAHLVLVHVRVRHHLVMIHSIVDSVVGGKAGGYRWWLVGWYLLKATLVIQVNVGATFTVRRRCCSWMGLNILRVLKFIIYNVSVVDMLQS